MEAFGYLADFVRGASNPYFMREVLPYWIGFALTPFVAKMVGRFFEGRW